jgi:uncharacterized protein (DUF697 family)
MTQNDKIHAVIHTAAAAAAGVGGGLAQVPGADSALIVPIQTAMILSIAQEHEVKITKGAAVDLLLTFSATMAGRAISQVLVGWIPGFGNAINAATAFSLTEAIGWAADTYFENNTQITA